MHVCGMCVHTEGGSVQNLRHSTGKHYFRDYYIILNNSVQSLEKVPLRNGAFYGTKLSCDPYAT